MIVEAIEAQFFGTNCWVLAPKPNSECFIVDPGITTPNIVGAVTELLKKFNLKPIATLLTHGHLDHTFSVLPVSREYAIPTFIQVSDRRLLADPWKALSPDGPSHQIMAGFGITNFAEPEDVRPIQGGEILDLANFNIQIIHAPGHTAGSVLFVVNDEYLISGDVLFRDAIGRTDLPTGSAKQMQRTLREKILPLPDELIVLPGHGRQTTIGRERKLNPYLQDNFLNQEGGRS